MRVGGRKQTTCHHLSLSLPCDTHTPYRIIWHQSPFYNLPLKLHYLQAVLQTLDLERVASYLNKEWVKVFSFLLEKKCAYFKSAIVYPRPKTFSVTQISRPLDANGKGYSMGDNKLKHLPTLANCLLSSFPDMPQPLKAYFHPLPQLDHCFTSIVL